MWLRQSLSRVEWGSVSFLDGVRRESPRCFHLLFTSTLMAAIEIECQLRSNRTCLNGVSRVATSY